MPVITIDLEKWRDQIAEVFDTFELAVSYSFVNKGSYRNSKLYIEALPSQSEEVKAYTVIFKSGLGDIQFHISKFQEHPKLVKALPFLSVIFDPTYVVTYIGADGKELFKLETVSDERYLVFTNNKNEYARIEAWKEFYEAVKRLNTVLSKCKPF